MAQGRDMNHQLETAPDGVAGMVERGLKLVQMRTQSQLVVAVERPRDLGKFKLRLLAISAEAGEDFYYSWPVKNHRQGCHDRRNCDCPDGAPVEGPGVGLAREAARLFENCAVFTEPEDSTEDGWLIRSTFIDFETNYSRSEVKRVSKGMPTRGGGWRTVSGKEGDLVYQQGASKVERDVILRSLPKHIILQAFESAKVAAVADKRPVDEQLTRLASRFAEEGITLEQLGMYVGCPLSENALRANGQNANRACAHLRGLLTAIRGGDADKDQIFPPTKGSKAAAPGVAQDVASAAIKPKARAKKTTRPPAAERMQQAARQTITGKDSEALWGMVREVATSRGVPDPGGADSEMVASALIALLGKHGFEKVSEITKRILPAILDDLSNLKFEVPEPEPADESTAATQMPAFTTDAEVEEVE